MRAINEGGFCSTETVLADLLTWLHWQNLDGVYVDTVARSVAVIAAVKRPGRHEEGD